MDRAFFFSLNGCGPVDVRPSRHGDGPGTRRSRQAALLGANLVGRVRFTYRREHFQHRRGPRRDGGSGANDHRYFAVCLATTLCSLNCRFACLVQLQTHREYFQMADARVVRLRHRGFSRASALERRTQSHLHSATQI